MRERREETRTDDGGHGVGGRQVVGTAGMGPARSGTARGGTWRCTRTPGHVLLLPKLAQHRGPRHLVLETPALPIRKPSPRSRTSRSSGHGKEVQEGACLRTRRKPAAAAAERVPSRKPERHGPRGRSDGVERRRRPGASHAPRSRQRWTEEEHGAGGHGILPRGREHGVGCRRSPALVQKSRGRNRQPNRQRTRRDGWRRTQIESPRDCDRREWKKTRGTGHQAASARRAHAGIHVLGWRRDQDGRGGSGQMVQKSIQPRKWGSPEATGRALQHWTVLRPSPFIAREMALNRILDHEAPCERRYWIERAWLHWSLPGERMMHRE